VAWRGWNEGLRASAALRHPDSGLPAEGVNIEYQKYMETLPSIHMVLAA